MSVTHYIVGYRPPDEKWRNYKAVYDSCKEAGLDVPDEVDDFFDGEAPSEHGIKVDLPQHGPKSIVREDGDDSSTWLELNVSDIPQNITVLRFVASY